MSIKFEPQFHKQISQNGKSNVWVALPHSKTTIPVKTRIYDQWQYEERLKIQEAGDTVLPLLNR